MGVFSGLNNLQDLTLQSRYAALLGITQSELEQDFAPCLSALAAQQSQPVMALLTEIRNWYNGFCFSDDGITVYNPFSALLLFENKRLRNYWFESGVPTFVSPGSGRFGRETPHQSHTLS